MGVEGRDCSYRMVSPARSCAFAAAACRCSWTCRCREERERTSCEQLVLVVVVALVVIAGWFVEKARMLKIARAHTHTPSFSLPF